MIIILIRKFVKGFIALKCKKYIFFVGPFFLRFFYGLKLTITVKSSSANNADKF